jgi:chromosome segregation ATPase
MGKGDSGRTAIRPAAGQGMSDWTEFDGRIARALERIRSGLASQNEADPARVAALTAALEDERAANAQLEERVRQLKDRQDSRVAALEASLAEARGQIARLDQAGQGLAQANAELRAAVGALRQAMTEGLADPELVNRAILAELESLRALRAADRAEIDAILGELAPHLAEG